MPSETAFNRPFVYLWNETVRGFKNLRTSTKCLLYTLTTYANSDGSSCFPSLKTLAEACCVSIRTISKNLKEARDAGLIRSQRRQMGMRHLSNLYEFLIPASEEEVEEVEEEPVIESAVAVQEEKIECLPVQRVKVKKRPMRKREVAQFLKLWKVLLSSKGAPSKQTLAKSSYEENSTALAWTIHQMMKVGREKIRNPVAYFLSIVKTLKHQQGPTYAFGREEIVWLMKTKKSPLQWIQGVRA